MNRQDQRRLLASILVLVAMPSYFICSFAHFCMGGHMAHPPYPWYHFASDVFYLILLVTALVFSFRSNIRRKKTFIILVVLTLLHVLLELTFVLALVLAGIAFIELTSRKATGRESQQSDAANSDSPSAPSE
jgi:hypothetical membrane protein